MSPDELDALPVGAIVHGVIGGHIAAAYVHLGYGRWSEIANRQQSAQQLLAAYREVREVEAS